MFDTRDDGERLGEADNPCFWLAEREHLSREGLTNASPPQFICERSRREDKVEVMADCRLRTRQINQRDTALR